MSEWQENAKTTPPQETPLELTSPPNNENTAAEAEEQAMLLIGQMQRLMSFSVSLSTLLEQERLSNLATPVMEVHLSSALLAMASLSMSTSDLLRMYTLTWKHSLPTMLSDGILNYFLPECDRLIEEMLILAYD